MILLISGDYFIADSFKNQPLIENSIAELFAATDYRIINLEAPLTANEPKNRILKTGPHSRTSAETVLPYLKQLNVDMVTLANNHILDYGVKGLNDTFNSLLENHISYVGAGNNLKEASKPFTLEKDGMKIAILNFAENEWSIAEENKPGANPLDIIDNVNQIKAAKVTHNKIICIIHGGHEYYKLPSPKMVKQYQFYVENGADAIIGHHSHCISGYEIYKSVPIFYSLGNFLFTLNSKQEAWYTGLLLTLEIAQDEKIKFELHPIKQKKESFKVGLLEGIDKNVVKDEINKLNNTISDMTLLKQSWNAFLDNHTKQYLDYFSPVSNISNRFVNAGLNRLQIHKLFLRKNYLKQLLNLLRCEAHVDTSQEVIKKHLKR